MNKLSLNFKYTALQILYWAEASIVFVYVGFYLQAAGMSNGSVGVTIACANILSFALSNAFAELCSGSRYCSPALWRSLRTGTL